MKISLITPTGGRPEAFALCEIWMGRQSLPYSEWIVVDDGPEETSMNLSQKVIRANIKWKPRENTQLSNLREAVKHVTGDVVAIVEDDDYYAPDYLGRMILPFGRGANLIGQQHPKYYDIQMCRHRTPPIKHSCLSQMVMDREFFEKVFKKVLNSYRGTHLDRQLWDHRDSYKKFLWPTSEQCVSIKGMPGRGNVTSDRNKKKFWSPDQELKKFKAWLGEDWVYYEPYLGVYDDKPTKRAEESTSAA